MQHDAVEVGRDALVHDQGDVRDSNGHVALMNADVACDDASYASMAVHQESARVHAAHAVALRVLDKLERVCAEERVSTSDLLNVLVGEEANLFSPTPSYVEAVQRADRSARAQRASELAQHVSPYRASSLQNDEAKVMRQHFVHATRAYVDPSVPLKQPFTYTLMRRGKRDSHAGTYHHLFHPSPENGQVAATSAAAASGPTTYTGARGTADHRRRAQDQRQRSASRRTTQSSEATPRRVLKVRPDFVPACATPGYRSRATVSPSTTSNTPS